MIPVLDKGYAILHDKMGDDLMVVNAARTSFNARAEWTYQYTDDEVEKILRMGDEKLLNFCAREGHWSPFSHPQVHLEFKLPGMVLDQLVKHRIGISHNDDEAFQAWQNAGDNQLSMRYKEPADFYVPGSDEWRGAPDNKKQGSKGHIKPHIGLTFRNDLIRHIEESVHIYNDALEHGVAPEQARLFIPYYAMYTNRVWTSSLYGIINLLKLRLEHDSQFEIREYAKAVKALVQPLFPYTFKAFGLED